LFIYAGQTVHEIKIEISRGPSVHKESRPDVQVTTNRIQIWRGKNVKLFAKDSFYLIQEQLSNFKFSNGEDSDVQHLGAAQGVRELELEDSELLLALIPDVAES